MLFILRVHQTARAFTLLNRLAISIIIYRLFLTFFTPGFHTWQNLTRGLELSGQAPYTCFDLNLGWELFILLRE